MLSTSGRAWPTNAAAAAAELERLQVAQAEFLKVRCAAQISQACDNLCLNVFLWRPDVVLLSGHRLERSLQQAAGIDPACGQQQAHNTCTGGADCLDIGRAGSTCRKCRRSCRPPAASAQHWRRRTAGCVSAPARPPPLRLWTMRLPSRPAPAHSISFAFLEIEIVYSLEQVIRVGHTTGFKHSVYECKLSHGSMWHSV